jgi:5-methyltetrahydropteroyltriglutamate--homocysteine methyltransferase
MLGVHKKAALVEGGWRVRFIYLGPFRIVLAQIARTLTAVEGFGEWDIDAFLWGDWHGDQRVGDESTTRPRRLGVTGKLRRKRHLSAEEFTYLRGRPTRALKKITLASPSLFSNLWQPDLPSAAYPSLDGFLADVVNILREEVAELARRGATTIQLEAQHYPLLLDPKTRAFYETRGWTLEK